MNSLYPAAMKEEFPIGAPIHMMPNTSIVEDFNVSIKHCGKRPKFGIFQIEYITNKDLVDSIFLEEKIED